MATARGFQVIGVLDGGSSAKGEDVWYQLDLFDGTQRFKAGFFVARDKFAAVIHALIHFGGLTREEYLKHNPAAEVEGQAEKVYAPPIVDVFAGQSTARNMAILALQTGDPARPMNLHFAADASVLRKLIATAESCLADLERSPGASKPVH